MTQSWRATAGSPFTPEKQSAVGARGMVTSNHPLASALIGEIAGELRKVLGEYRARTS